VDFVGLQNQLILVALLMVMGAPTVIGLIVSELLEFGVVAQCPDLWEKRHQA
jgi:hypothetical protein